MIRERNPSTRIGTTTLTPPIGRFLLSNRKPRLYERCEWCEGCERCEPLPNGGCSITRTMVPHVCAAQKMIEPIHQRNGAMISEKARCRRRRPYPCPPTPHPSTHRFIRFISFVASIAHTLSPPPLPPLSCTVQRERSRGFSSVHTHSVCTDVSRRTHISPPTPALSSPIHPFIPLLSPRNGAMRSAVYGEV